MHPKGTNSMAASGLGTVRAISPVLHELAYKTDSWPCGASISDNVSHLFLGLHGLSLAESRDY